MDTDRETLGEEGDEAQEAQSRFPLAVRSQRLLQIILGLFWILDAALQFQPFMFGRGFVENNILANASGQPFVLGDFITHIGNFLGPDIAVWNTFFALIQLFIGVGLLFKGTVRTALVVSFAWVLGIWVIGEGMGMLLTGSATALTGAPGSVLLYGLIGLMAWPRPPRRFAVDWSDRPEGVATSAAAQGIGGTITPLAVWAGYWSLAAVLFLLPDNRPNSSIQGTIVGSADSVPEWYNHFLVHLSNAFSASGSQPAWILAAVCVAIGLGPLVVRRPGWFLAAGALLSALMWIAGQGLAGNIFSGSDTDPNTGPLVILLAAAMVPTVIASKTAWRSPAGEILRRSPAAAVLGIAALGAALALSASYPVAASAPASADADSAMSGMAMDGSMSGSGSGSTTQSATASTCVPHQSGLKISGLDLNNTPYMIMSGKNGMDMNGSDASAAAGFNTTTPNWHYTGPAIPQAEASQLLGDGNNGPSDIHMAESGCAPSLTAADDIGAVQYVQATSAAVSGYATPAAALAAGYEPASPTDYPVVIYENPTIVAANAAAQRTLDPQYVDGLVYASTPSGGDVLAAAMYILPSTETKVPMPYGALVQWHRRTQVCGPATPSPTMPFDITGFPPCAAGTQLQPTPYVSMVWQVPVAGGPLAIQPPDIQIVEAAVMQLNGTSVASQG
jgi:hypothetical protein